MIKYILKRLLAMIPVVLLVIFIIYLILYLTPGDAAGIILGADYTQEGAHAIREKLGLNRPFLIQYFDYVFKLVRGDLGVSYITGSPVMDQISVRFPNTLILVLISMFFCILMSMPIGIQSAVKPNSILSNISSALAMIGLAMPNFWLGLLAILLFSVKLGWLPSAGSMTPAGLVLPAFTQSVAFMVGIMRQTRSSMLETLSQDYVRTAKAKGVSRHDVINKHALKNAVLPVITIIGLNLGMQLGGSVLTESVFAFPGMGRLLIGAINQRDTPTILSSLVVLAICVAVANLAVDIIYAFVDPRIRAAYSAGRK